MAAHITEEQAERMWRKAKPVPSEIYILAFAPNQNGALEICDLIETARRYAPHFLRSIYRNPKISHVAAIRPDRWGGCKPLSLARAIVR